MPSDVAEDADFGNSVCISNDFIVIGAPYDVVDSEETGSAYLYSGIFSTLSPTPPSILPTKLPTNVPSLPTNEPTDLPTVETSIPTNAPTLGPTVKPTLLTSTEVAELPTTLTTDLFSKNTSNQDNHNNPVLLILVICLICVSIIVLLICLWKKKNEAINNNGKHMSIITQLSNEVNDHQDLDT